MAQTIAMLRPLCFAKWDKIFCFSGQAMKSLDAPKCKSICPHRLNPGVSIHLSSFAMSSLFRDALEGAEMRNHLVSQSGLRPAMATPRVPLLARDMTRIEFIIIAAGWSTALVAVLIRSFIG